MISDWFIHIELNLSASDEQAMLLMMELTIPSRGMSIYTQNTKDTTEISFYEPARSITLAMNNAFYRVKNAINSVGINANIVQVRVTSRENRLRELKAQGITEDIIL